MSLVRVLRFMRLTMMQIWMEMALRQLGCNPATPAVFIGGKYIGSAKDVISLHVDGSLKQKLIEARAIWF